MQRAGVAWPAIPVAFQGVSMRALFGYEGPSMMDGVEISDNSSDDAMDAWNEHIEEVEAAADGFLIGDNSTTLVFVHAGGAVLSLEIPVFHDFSAFLGWMMRQVYTRAILPAEDISPAVFL